MKAISACLILLASAASAAMPKGVLYVRGQVSSPEVLLAANRSDKACRILWDGTGEKPVLALDMGAPSVGGYAVFNVTGTKGRPTLRLAYANHPDGLGEKGCFARETSARYLGPDFDIPVLPGNINRHEIYSIGRTGLYVAPLIQGQERYVRVQLDTPGEVSVGSFEIVNADVFSTEPRRGSFRCSDDRLTRLWDISVWTCQLASFPNHDAWRIVAGRLLPRKLEQAEADCWQRRPAAADGTLRLDFEFDANPHFPVGTFEILVGDRRVAVKQDATNEVRHVEVPVKRGERIGLSVPKESWPVIWNMTLGGASLMDLAGWDYARTLPYIADGAKRDRLIWSGDLWWAERNMFYGFGGESPYMKGSVKMLAFNRTPEGYVHASPYAERSVRPPTGDYGPFGSDEFAAWFVPVTWDYYLYTADRETLREVWPDVVALMRYLNAHRRGDGIFEQRKATCKGAVGLQFGGTSLYHRAYMNILLWKTLEDAASIAAALGHDAEAVAWRADAARFADVVRKTFWDEKGGFFRFATEDGKFRFVANALALATRFATPQEAARIMPQLKYDKHGKFQALAARGKFEYGDTAGGLKALEDHNWYKLLDPSWKGALTVTECMHLHHRGWGDESHPDTAIAGIYSSYILGIVPLAPGFQRFSFRPQTDGLTFAEGSVPTCFGEIRARWEKKGGGVTFTITVPPGTTAEFAWRDQRRVLPPGTHVVKCPVDAGAAVRAEVPVAKDGTYRRVPLPDGDATAAIQGAIDQAFAGGGGTVVVGKGEWRVKALRLRSRVTLRLEAGATILGSRNPDDYFILDDDKVEPVPREWITHEAWTLEQSCTLDNFTRYPASRWNNGLIRLLGAEDAAIIGEPGSVIDGCNPYDPIGEEFYRGPQGISAINCKRLVLKGYTIRQTGNWAHRIADTTDLLVENVTCEAGHDGVHVNGCDGVTIRKCVMKTGDDCVAGFDNSNVLVEDCYLNTACSGFRFAGTDVKIRRCTLKGPAEFGFRGSLSKEDKAAGAPSGKAKRNNMLSFFTYYSDSTHPVRRNAGKIEIVDCTSDDTDRLLHYNYGNEKWQRGKPMTDISFRNVRATRVKMPIALWGDRDVPVMIALRDCEIGFSTPQKEFIRGAYVSAIDLENVKVSGVGDGPLIRLWHADTLRPAVRVDKCIGVGKDVTPADKPWNVRGI